MPFILLFSFSLSYYVFKKLIEHIIPLSLLCWFISYSCALLFQWLLSDFHYTSLTCNSPYSSDIVPLYILHKNLITIRSRLLIFLFISWALFDMHFISSGYKPTICCYCFYLKPTIIFSVFKIIQTNIFIFTCAITIFYFFVYLKRPGRPCASFEVGDEKCSRLYFILKRTSLTIGSLKLC